jgi:hypothetical protein
MVGTARGEPSNAFAKGLFAAVLAGILFRQSRGEIVRAADAIIARWTRLALGR